MALTPLHSSQYLISTTKPIQGVSGAEWNGTLKSSIGTLTFTVAGTGTAKMVTLPAGKKIIFPDLCRFVCPAGAVTADAEIGHSAYKTRGVPVAASPSAFLLDSDIGGGAVDTAFLLPAIGYFILDSDGPVDIEMLIETANSPAAGTALVLVVWASVGK